MLAFINRELNQTFFKEKEISVSVTLVRADIKKKKRYRAVHKNVVIITLGNE